ncbi:MAG: AbrB family transcriptional regulator [Bacteroidales bacterium]|jgi:hypothetical protein|nr:AbrB family transcriptional regulator [Bacteroidales bacterium]
MTGNEKSPAAGQELLKSGCKGSVFSTTYQVLEILKAGNKITAVGLNREIGFNDARKAISVLREKGYPIGDFRQADHRKVYYLPYDWERIMSDAKTNDNQLKLFDND